MNPRRRHDQANLYLAGSFWAGCVYSHATSEKYPTIYHSWRSLVAMARLPSSSSLASWFPSTVMQKRDRTVYAKWIILTKLDVWLTPNVSLVKPQLCWVASAHPCAISGISPIFSRQLNPYIYAGEAPEISGGSTDQPKMVGFSHETRDFVNDFHPKSREISRKDIGSLDQDVFDVFQPTKNWMKIKRNRDGGRSNIEVGCNSLLLNMTQSLL